jgi:hypothetical protein
METPHPEQNIEFAQIGKQILRLRGDVDRLVREGKYEEAARARDERASLEWKLEKSGNPTLIRNVEIAKSLWGPVLAGNLQPKDTAIDESLLRKLPIATYPIRWAICNIKQPPIATLQLRADVESMTSHYFRATFPVISSSALRRATFTHEWITELGNETARSKSAIIWVITDLEWLNSAGIFSVLLKRFENSSTEFVACIDRFEEPLARQIAGLSSVTVIEARWGGGMEAFQ